MRWCSFIRFSGLFPHLSHGKHNGFPGIEAYRHNAETLRHNESEAIIASLFWLPKSLCTSELHFLVAGAAGRALTLLNPNLDPFGQIRRERLIYALLLYPNTSKN